MTVSDSTGKTCLICRKDVARIKRVKDAKGHYYCEPCYAAHQQTVPHAGQAVPATPPRPIPKAAVPPAANTPAPAKNSCPGCHAKLPPNTLFCVACGYNLRLGKQATTKLKKEIDWMAGLSLVPLEVWLATGGIALFAVICLAAPLFTTKLDKVCGISFAIILVIILTAGSRKCRRILVDEYGWSETLFRIPFLRNFVFLGGLLSVPKLWLITLRYGAAAAVFTVAGIFMLSAFVPPDPDDHGTSQGSKVSQVSHSADFATPPAFSLAVPGVERARLTSDGPDGTRQLWIYRPTGTHPDHSLPCIFIAPAGTAMIFGASLDEDDSEHYETYAKEGFMVVAYSLDGEEVETPGGDSFQDAVRAIKSFHASHGGIANAQRAIDYVLHNLPEADSQRLYAMGGGSAGAVALCLAAAEPRINAVCALTPIPDAAAGRDNADADIAKIQESIPEIRDFIRQVSPVNHIREMHCPIFIYQPGIDFLKTRADVEAYCKTLTDAGIAVTYQLGPSDWEALKKEDPNPEITWLKTLKTNPTPATTTPVTPG